MEGIMSLEKLPPWAERHNYFHHSNPSMPDGYTFHNKCFVRPLVDHSWKVLKGN